MSKKPIEQPSLNQKNKKLLGFLQASGFCIKWWLNSELGGVAKAETRGDTLYIIFREEKDVDQKTISHELLHLFLFVKGCPRLIPLVGEYENAVIMLNDIFDHKIMTPLLAEMGISIQEQEVPFIEELIENIETKVGNLSEDYPKSLLLSIFFVRAQEMGVKRSKLNKLADYLKSKELYDQEVIETITSKLSLSDYSLKTIAKLKQECKEALPLKNVADIEYYKTKAQKINPSASLGAGGTS